MGRRQHAPRIKRAKCCEHRGRPCPKNFASHFCRWCENIHCLPDQTPQIPRPDPWALPERKGQS